MLVQKSFFSVVVQPDTKPYFKIVNLAGKIDKDVHSFFLDLLASDVCASGGGAAGALARSSGSTCLCGTVAALLRAGGCA